MDRCVKLGGYISCQMDDALSESLSVLASSRCHNVFSPQHVAEDGRST